MESFIIIPFPFPLISQYDLNNVERDVKPQIIKVDYKFYALRVGPLEKEFGGNTVMTE